MATQINFRGEINEMSAAYFCREIDALAPRSSAELYLYTPGGDIYAGGEMVNSFRNACRKRGCKLSVEVGSMCASMGAALLAAAKADGCKTRCHSNSEVMFHGCYGLAFGGADELTDQAKAMRDFNETVKADLAKCGITDTDEWFAADRMKFLNAQELADLGLVDEIIEEAASADPEAKSAALQIAAKFNHNPKGDKMEENTIKAEEVKPEEAAPEANEAAQAAEPQEVAENAAETPAEAVAEPVATEEAPSSEAAPEAVSDAPAAAPTEDEIEARVTDLANKRFAGLQAKHDKLISDLTNERDAALADLAAQKTLATSLQADIEKLESDLAALRDQLNAEQSAHEAVVAKALAPSDKINAWKDAYRQAKRTY